MKTTGKRLQGISIAALLVIVCVAGCSAQSTPEDAAREFAAVVYRFQSYLYRDDKLKDPEQRFPAKAYAKDKGALQQTITQESRDKVSIPRLGDGRVGLYYLLKDLGAAQEGRDYHLRVTKSRHPKLAIRKEGPDVARVVVKPVGRRLKTLSDPHLPKPIRNDGLTVVVVKEQGHWKVDLFETQAMLASIVLESAPESLDHYPLPPWWPGLPMPDPRDLAPVGDRFQRGLLQQL